VALRFVLLLGAYLAWGGLALILVVARENSSVNTISSNGRLTQVNQSGTTIYQMNPGPVRIILFGLAAALVISTASVVWRVVHHSAKVGITGMIVAGIAGAACLLGILTVGLFIVPVAALLVVLALPIAPVRTSVLPPPCARAGWYGDPAGRASWRYWNGSAWTEYFAPMNPRG
jgi:hypothetical protein